MFLHDVVGTRYHTYSLPSVAANDSTEKHTIFVAPFACTIESVAISATAAVTGDNTNRKNLNIIDGGAAGAGTSEIGNLNLATGTDLAAITKSELLGTDGAGTDADLDAGDFLILQVEQVSSGVLIPDSTIIVQYKPKQ